MKYSPNVVRDSLAADCCYEWLSRSAFDMVNFAGSIPLDAQPISFRAESAAISKKYCSQSNSGFSLQWSPAVARNIQAELHSSSDSYSPTAARRIRLSVMESPLTVVFCIFDASVRYKRFSQNRERLRSLIASLANVTTTEVITPVGLVTLSAAWLYKSLMTGYSAKKFCDTVIQFTLQELCVARPDELTPSLNVNMCLCKVAADLLCIERYRLIGLHLAHECINALLESEQFELWGVDRIVDALFGMMVYQMRATHSQDVIESASTSLDRLLEWCLESTRHRLWKHATANGSAAWPFLTKLCSYTLGVHNLFDLLDKKIVGREDHGFGFTELCFYFEQMIIFVCSVKNSVLEQSRLKVYSHLESILEKFPSVAGHDKGIEKCLVFACSRQLPILCASEYAKVTRHLLPQVLNIGICRAAGPRNDSDVVLVESLRCQVRAVNICASERAQCLHDARELSAAVSRWASKVSFLMGQICKCIHVYTNIWRQDHLEETSSIVSELIFQSRMLHVVLGSNIYSSNTSSAVAIRVFSGVVSSNISVAVFDFSHRFQTELSEIEMEVAKREMGLSALIEAATCAKNRDLLAADALQCLTAALNIS